MRDPVDALKHVLVSCYRTKKIGLSEGICLGSILFALPWLLGVFSIPTVPKVLVILEGACAKFQAWKVVENHWRSLKVPELADASSANFISISSMLKKCSML